jgi:hypothetical protein
MTPGDGNLEAARGGAIAARGPASISYAPATAVGFEIVPEVVRARLFARREIGSTALSASCDELQVRRRADGTHYQSGEAWWGDEARAVLFTIRREMANRGGRKYSPKGAWNVSGTVYHLGATGGPETSKWKFDAAASKGGNTSPPVTTSDPLDLLPADVAAPVRGGLRDVWRESSTGSAAEYLTAIRVVENRVLLLEANRTARSIRALASATWVLTTLDAPITERAPFNFTCDEGELYTGAPDQLGGASGEQPLMPGE